MADPDSIPMITDAEVEKHRRQAALCVLRSFVVISFGLANLCVGRSLARKTEEDACAADVLIRRKRAN
jgi:hypothetical protein